ncbi:unnamed protein product [Sordaria macrospora k-hell]|uniref:WGS project CABT00000000 data, contig 2.10 n=1 Tax=Sordaria macrospora (strain ATCC MYA-333 / DSM 997 / K(L3346) / K-hell) TaxID=771870 RepID=F7VW22_SORMK|nr:uncharacterized protein SMAC_03400 [Sordaria macrospora k-hell]CCC09844.1 unnamed protein product [Sordaria macrospora k-hell]
MSAQQDLQELLRLLTVGRKTPMLQAMAQIKSLQAVEIRSIQQIAEAPFDTIKTALNDEKTAKSLQNACKAAMKRTSTAGGSTGTKRGAPLSTDSPSKRLRHDDNPLMPSRTPGKELTPQELEASLELPLCQDEELISQTVLETNRAPLVLAFAVELLRHTRPEQPLSSRLSLGQAVVSANSRSKAPQEESQPPPPPPQAPQPKTVHPFFQPTTSNIHWSPSGLPLISKDSRFLAHSTKITSPSQEKILLNNLFRTHPNLESASHNAWAYRVRTPSNANRIIEKSFDDGEQGAGDFMLRILREMDIDDTLVVMTRWFGGTMLGPDRWRLMRVVVLAAVNERNRKSGGGAELEVGGEGEAVAVWGLDVEKGSTSSTSTMGGKRDSYGTSVVGMQIHKPEIARNYLLRSFHTATATPITIPFLLGSPSGTAEQKKTTTTTKTKKMQKQLETEREENLGLLLGALRLLFDSWKGHLTAAELDKRAWAWYTAVRPDVEAGPGGWGAKGRLELKRILELRRKEDSQN